MIDLDQLKWPESGLLPAIAQDAERGTVLTLAWQNREALTATLQSGYVHYWSRSRQALWKKGETSGHTQAIVEVRFDCDLDAVLMLVRPDGPACHTGRPSCFFNLPEADVLHAQDENPWPQPDILVRLAEVIEARRQADGQSSYVKSLLNDANKAAAKVKEEAGELIDAVAEESDGHVAAEAADLIFHALVLAAGRGVDWSQIAAVLESRFGVGGHVEKANRRKD